MTHALYEVARMLDGANLYFNIGRHRPDTFLISVTAVGARIEIDVFEDGHLEVCCFRGDEGPETGPNVLQEIIREFGEK